MITRFVSGISLLALAACVGTATPGDTGASRDGGDGGATNPSRTDAPAALSIDASAPDASLANTMATTSADDASNPGDAPLEGSVDAEDGGNDVAVIVRSASCDYVIDTAPVVAATYASGAMPSYTKGGTIADGTYWLTGLVIDGAPGANAPTYQETVEIFGTSWNNVDVYMGMTRQETETLTVQGAAGTLMYTCDSLNDPALLQKTVSFTFEVDGATLLLADETDGYSLTYVRQSP